jgi:SAM-dependent methyltransferase
MTIATELKAITADTSSAALYSEYTGIPVEIVEQCAAKFGAFNQVTWSECQGATFCDKAKVYYENTDEYLFDLLHGSRSKAWRKQVYQHFGHWKWMTSVGPDVIEFGGGLGLTCSLLREEGRSVTYCDVDGPAAKFARWYFERTGQRDIEILHTPSSELVLPEGRQWDLVFSDSVIEHVPDPAATVERLARALKPGGLMYLIIDAHDVGPAFPMHQHVHLKDLLAGSPTLRSLAHVHHDGDVVNAFRRMG